ncbi:MAG TPA: OmpH family outer membrane protein [Candidatus Binataceae bacterium]|nr:OmpH family outer membrane protein [Candidatus Binataceae bacterium]
MKHWGFIAGALLIAMTTTGAARADVRLAYVDIQRALNECRAGRDAKVKFRGRVERLQSQLESEQKNVERLKQELETKGALMQPDQRQNLEDDYSKKLRQFQDDYKNSRDELQQRDNEITGAIVRDLAMVVREVSEKDGYTMVMEKGSLLWAAPSIDITDQVIRAYDAMNVQPGSLSQKATAAGAGRFGSAATRSLGTPKTGGRSTITK